MRVVRGKSLIRSAGLVAVVSVAAAAFGPASRQDPGYTTIAGDAEPLRSAFNADAGKVRLLMYVSPTCGGCLRGARDMQKHLLSRNDDQRLAVYVVWAPKNGARTRHVDGATGLVTDTRATHYWDESSAIADPIDERLDLTGPCAGIFMLYGPDATWEGVESPLPIYTEDAHASEFDREGPQLDPKRLSSIVSEALAEL